MENDDGGCPPHRRQKCLDGRRVERVVADLEKEDVVGRGKRVGRDGGLVGTE